MSTDALTSTAGVATRTSVGAKLLNVLAAPAEVFDEVSASPSNSANWLVPVILVSLSSLLLLGSTADAARTTAMIAPFVADGKLTPEQASGLSSHWQSVSGIAVCLSALAGTLWSALVIWSIGRVFLKSRFAFRKALEVAGLSSTVLVLGAMVTWLLICATGDAAARPALSLLCIGLPPGNTWRVASELMDCFHLWAIAILAVGLSKLGAVTVKESAFWVLGYWLAGRMALVILA